MKHISKLLLLSLFISGCFPAIFTTTTVTTLSLSKDRTLGETIDDIKILSYIEKAFLKQGIRDLYSKIKINVVNGRVLYTGNVANQEDIITAVDIAWSQLGVKEVINELSVSEKSNYFDLGQYSKDSFITTQVKSRLMFSSGIKFVNYTVTTLNNIVYLFGIARSQEELDKVSNIVAKVSGVQEVVNHVHIRPLNSGNPNPDKVEIPYTYQEVVEK